VPKNTYKRRVEFAETDAAGIVHFSVFFRYMEEAEHAVWRQAGLNIAESGENVSWPRIAAKFDFTAPLRFQEEFEIVTEIGAVTRSTIQWAHVLTRGETTIGTGTVTAVCVNKLAGGGMKSAPIPEEIISKLRLALTS
jgi:4-hydroxybenzoyl-CoA thioesterase/acyl-CoA thioester hydrolase